MLTAVEINPKSPPKMIVIWMHGLGADGYDFADIVPQLHLPEDAAIRFVFPHAPLRPVTYASGMTMRAWFDITGLDKNQPEDAVGIKQSQQLIEQLIAQELLEGLTSEQIVLAGFSQGGAMALQCGLRYPQKLAGILVLSAWLPLSYSVDSERSAANLQTPILMLHGSRDTLVPLTWAQEGLDYLQKLGYPAELRSYPMEHTVCPQEIDTIAEWFEGVVYDIHKTIF